MVDACFSNDITMRQSKAILLYEGDRRSYATIHDINSDSKGATSIGAGVPLDVATLSNLTQLLDRNNTIGGFIPPQVLSIGMESLVWWVKPAPRRVHFRTGERIIGKRSGITPHPGLLIGVNSGGGWFVFAVKGNQRPDENTPLWQAPYFNTYESGSICQGSVQIPDSVDVKDIPKWEDCLFNSTYTHPNIHRIKGLVSYAKGPHQFWRDMLDGKYKKFPERYLVPAKRTVGDVIRSINGGSR